MRQRLHKVRRTAGAGVLGILTAEIRDAKTGDLLETRVRKNLVVDSGLNLLRDMLGDDRNKAPNYFYLGTNATAAQASDTVSTITSPFTKVFTARVQGNKAITFQTFVTADEANGMTWKEAGLVNTYDGTDTLFARVAITPIVKTAAVTVTFSWSITLSAA